MALIVKWEAAIVITNSLVAATLNSMIFYFVYRYPSLRTSFHATILNCCVADLLVSANMLASAIHNLLGQRNPVAPYTVWCGVTGFVNLLTFVVSVMSLAAVSLNRYCIVCKRHLHDKFFSRNGTAGYILCVWVLSALLSAPPFFGWARFSYHAGKSICFADWKASVSYMIFMISICFCGPIAATLASLYFILRIKRRVANVLIVVEQDASSCPPSIDRKKQKADKEDWSISLSIAAMTFVFFVAWGPFVVVMFLETFGASSMPRWLDFGTLFLGFLNSTANPIIWLTANSNFRRAFLKFCRKNVSQNGFVHSINNTTTGK